MLMAYVMNSPADAVCSTSAKLEQRRSAETHRQEMIADIARFLASWNLPVMVVHIPSRDELLSGE